jgi:hypothetical protein
VREKRERKWGLTGSCGLYPIFALPTTNNEQPTTSPIIPHWFSFRRAVHRQSSRSMDPSFERARRGEKERE